MTFRKAVGAISVIVTILAGCAASHPMIALDEAGRGARGLPDHFLIGAPADTALVEPAPGQDCHSPMIDPRDRTRLILVRSSEGRGDYQAPPGRYGLHEGELLRLDCSSGRAIGIVRR